MSAIMARMTKRDAPILSLVVVLIFLPFFPVSLLEAQTSASVAEREAALRGELEQLEKEIKAQQEILKSKQRESVSLERDIAILNAEIEQAKLSIRAKNIRIGNLGTDITKKSTTIKGLEAKLERGRESLAELIRKTNEIDSYSLPEIVLSSREMSDIFKDVDSYMTIKSSLHDLFAEVRDTKAETEAEREALDKTRRSEIDARVEIEAEKRIIEKNEATKKRLLSLSREQEKAYGQVIKEREKRAAAIRSALFALRDSAAIPFGQALDFANKASERTGVRTAFILAILTQESNLGQNVGTCNRAGDPPAKRWQAIMPGPNDNATRNDQAVFIELMQELGFDPEQMPLSCPQGSGWGGAMGPSQFIPTTWKAYKNRIATATGHNPPNPWNPGDAITATALYLKDLRADRGGYSAEHEAAARYYAGGAWKTRGQGYATSVLNHARNIQENMIDPLSSI